MTGTVQMFINGKLELSKAVHSFDYMEKVVTSWKEKILPVLTSEDNYEIVLRTFSDFNKRNSSLKTKTK